MSSNSTIVKLNIGGTVFQTTKSTLSKFDGFFRKMFETAIPLDKDETGAIFIDRDPSHFNRILNFMRDGDVELPESFESLKEIRNEAQYYLLDGLVELCTAKISTDRIKLNVGGTIFETTKTTLMKYDGKLKEMCIAHDSNISDTIFIDRSPKVFDIILNYLRVEKVMWTSSYQETLEVSSQLRRLNMRSVAVQFQDTVYSIKEDMRDVFRPT